MGAHSCTRTVARSAQLCSNLHMPPPRIGPDQRLRRLRESTGVSMSSLADAASCSYRHLQMIETTGRQPSPELAHRIARALSQAVGRDVSVDEFYDGRPARSAA